MKKIKFRSDMEVELISSMGDDKMVAQAARVSTLGLDNDREKFVGLIRALLTAKPTPHWSPFMHPTITVSFSVPLFVRSQLVTHYSLARSEFSMRYSEALPEFWVPAADRPIVQAGRALDYQREQGTSVQFSDTMTSLRMSAERDWNTYKFLIGEGVANEVARAVLPQNTYTTLWLTGNLRSWMSMLISRDDPHAQWETQEVGRKVSAIFEEHFPVTFEAWKGLQA